MQFYQMQLGAVALVLAEAIFRKTGAEVPHNRVARHLRDHTRGRDAVAEPISTHEGGLLDGERFHGQTVDQHVLHEHTERSHGATHRLVRGAEDIDAIDFLGLENRHRPRDVFAGHEFCEDLLPLQLGELLGVV